MSELLTYGEAARLLRIAEVTLRRWVSLRKIPFIKLGGAVRFDRDDIDRWLQDSRVDVATGRAS